MSVMHDFYGSAPDGNVIVSYSLKLPFAINEIAWIFGFVPKRPPGISKEFEVLRCFFSEFTRKIKRCR